MGLLYDREIREVERVLLMYLNPILKVKHLSGNEVTNLHYEFLSGFEIMWERNKVRNDFILTGSFDHVEVDDLKSPTGQIDKPFSFGGGLGAIVSNLEHSPDAPLFNSHAYKLLLEALATSPENNIFYDYIQRKLRAWYKEIQRNSSASMVSADPRWVKRMGPHFVKRYQVAMKGYKIMKKLIK